jgi:ferredoxin
MALCEGLDPDRFEVQADGKVLVQRDELEDGAAIELVRDAVESCPTQALRILD